MICPVLFTRDLSALKKWRDAGEVETPEQYSALDMERMMKLQDVILKAMAKKITWWDAAEIIGVSDRTMRRWRERLEADGGSVKSDGYRGASRGICPEQRPVAGPELAHRSAIAVRHPDVGTVKG